VKTKLEQKRKDHGYETYLNENETLELAWSKVMNEKKTKKKLS